MAFREGTDGKFYGVWAKHRKGRDSYQDKDWPVKVTLGSKDEAIAALRMILREIGGDEQIEEAPF